MAAGIDYHFIETDRKLAASLGHLVPGATEERLEALAAGSYAAIFALDSLEHCDEPEQILTGLADALTPQGVLVLSGPTENALYRLGRRIAGFSGGYHHANIYQIHGMIDRRLQRLETRRGPFAAPLFILTAWSRV